MNIRPSTADDAAELHDLYLAAFGDDENVVVEELAQALITMDERTRLSLVADRDGELVGHVVFSPAELELDGVFASILAPLAVKPRAQRQGVGSKLVREGLERLTECGTNVVFVYGDPDYYTRFGFEQATASNFAPPYPLTYPTGWHALVINPYSSVQTPTKVSCVHPLMKAELW